MTDQFWPKEQSHPPLGMLMLHLDGGLDDRDRDGVTRHLQDCWECRTRSEDIQRGIHRFMECRSKLLIPAVPDSPSRGNVRRQVRQEIERQRRSPRRWLRRVFTGARFTYSSAAAAAIFLVCVFLLVSSRPAVVSASTLIERTSRARVSETAGGTKALRSRLRIRSGDRVAERTVIVGNAASAEPVADAATWIPGNIDPVPVVWSDPLDARGFEKWRSTLRAGDDLVTRTGGSLTLRTTGGEGSAIVSASLTVRSSDWHPISKRIEFRHFPPLEIVEMESSVIEMPAPRVEVAAAPALRTAKRSPFSEVLPAPKLVEAPKSVAIDLEEAEVSLRELLHSVAADQTEAYEILRTPDAIRFRPLDPDTDLMQQIVGAVSVLPGVSLVEKQPQPETTAVQIAPPSPEYSTKPPLDEELRDYFGGLELANNYLAMARDAHRKAFVIASALRQLAERYPEPEWEKMPTALRSRVLRIATDQTISLQAGSAEYLRTVSMVLDEMLRRHGPPAILPETPIRTGCRSWQPVAPDVTADLLRLQDAFRRLFVEVQGDQQMVITAEGLLGEVVSARQSLQHNLSRLCEVR